MKKEVDCVVCKEAFLLRIKSFFCCDECLKDRKNYYNWYHHNITKLDTKKMERRAETSRKYRKIKKVVETKELKERIKNAKHPKETKN